MDHLFASVGLVDWQVLDLAENEIVTWSNDKLFVPRVGAPQGQNPSNNKLPLQRIQPIAEALGRNRTLQSLNLGHNKIGSEGVKEVSRIPVIRC